MSDDPQIPTPAEPPPPLATVLVVEDDDQVRRFMRLALEKDRYRVLEARNGEEALTLYGGYSGSLDLLVADLVMPRMGGQELAVRLVSRHPAMRVLYMSGYTALEFQAHGFLPPGLPFLQKPFSLEILRQMVRELLGITKSPAAELVPDPMPWQDSP
jgi:DNA-binding NtrC family response regulator